MINFYIVYFAVTFKPPNKVITSGGVQFSLLLGFTHVIRVALGGQAKSEHGYRIELITYHSY